MHNLDAMRSESPTDITAQSLHLIETEQVKWTLERLRGWIDECERVLAKLDELQTEQAVQSLRSLMSPELARKRELLAEQQSRWKGD